MDQDGNLMGIAGRIMPALQLLLSYLEEGIASTEARFRDDGHEPDDDSATFNADVRLHVRTKMRKHLPMPAKAAMSPVHLPLGPYHVKMLHADDGSLPRPRTESRRLFYAVNDYGIMSLNVTPPDELVEIEDDTTEVQDGSLVLVWDSSGADLVQADLYLTSLSPWPGQKLDLLATTAVESEEDITDIRATEQPDEEAEAVGSEDDPKPARPSEDESETDE
jgi:hypothetical protein